MYKFKSAITRGGGILTPDVIEITKRSVTYLKRNKILIGKDSTSIPIKQVSSVSIDTTLLGTHISIVGRGKSQINCRNFAKRDAKEIKRVIEMYINE